MAVNLQTAKQLIQQRGVQPPPGADYDSWALQWLQSAVNAGDPEAVRATGGSVAEGGGAEDQIADWSSAAPSSTWYGQRAPSPGELRRYAKETGQSEDYARFSDRQLSDWIGRKWDVSGGFFTNDFGDRVEKPTESGAKSKAAGFATGESSAGKGGGGGGGSTAASSAYSALDDPLQASLYQLAQSRGIQGQGDITNAQSLAGGGIFTWGQPQAATPAPAATPATPRMMEAQPRAETQPTSPFVTNTPLAGATSPLATALGTAGNAWSNWSAPAATQTPQQTPWQGIGAQQPATGALDTSLVTKYKGRAQNPAQWWMK